MSTYLDTARIIAQRAHAGVMDKLGTSPYLDHVAFVAAGVAHLGPDYETAAWLHDVVEDTKWDMARIRAFMAQSGTPLPWDIALDVEALTKRPHEPNRVAYARAGARKRSRTVKRWDVRHNSDPRRLALLDDATRPRLNHKYLRVAIPILDQCAAEAGDSDRSAWKARVIEGVIERTCILTDDGDRIEVTASWDDYLHSGSFTVKIREHIDRTPTVFEDVQVVVRECVLGRPLRMDLRPMTPGQDTRGLFLGAVKQIDVHVDSAAAAEAS